MCTIAGYVGTKRAAPILLDMLLREEAYDAGYYSGIATVSDGKLYYRKLMGDAKRLIECTDAATLPGNIGIIHGRTKSGGDDAWAHPFIAQKNGTPYLAYVANGAQGFFDKQARTSFLTVAKDLMAQGYTMQSRAVLENSDYPKLPDGYSVHASDVMAQLIMHYIDRGEAPASAMEQAYCALPGEIVGLVLSLQAPDRIAFSRINQPMQLSFCDHGAYVATTALAFPKDAGAAKLLGAQTCGYISRDAYEEKPFDKPVCRVSPVTDAVRARGAQLLYGILQNKKVTFAELRGLAADAFDKELYDVFPASFLAYDLVKTALQDGSVKTECIRVEGVNENLTAPQLMLWS